MEIDPTAKLQDIRIDGTVPPIAKPFRADSLLNIPPRRFVQDKLFQRGQVTCLAGSGGAGKSTFTLISKVAQVTGTNLLGFKVYEPGPCWYIHGEDDTVEVMRRLKAICSHFNIDPAALENKLWLSCVDDTPFALLETDGDGTFAIDSIVDDIIKTIERHKFLITTLDPWGDFFGGRENDTESMRLGGTTLNRIARQTDSAVVVLHHVRKGANGADVDAIRGGKSFTDKLRNNLMLVPMTDADGDLLGVEKNETAHFLSLVSVKANYVPPATDGHWFQRQSVNLHNSDGLYPDDMLGVLAPHTFEAAFEKLTTGTIREILDAVDARPENDLFSQRMQERERWLGTEIMRIAGKSKGHAKTIIRGWLDSGLLREVEFQNSNWKLRKGVKSDRTKMPGGAF